MKKVMMVIACGILLTSQACAQKKPKSEVPQPVKDAFVTKFPNVSKVKWEKEEGNEWEADFKMNKVAYSASFKASGEWIETEHEISSSELPEAVKNTLKIQFSDYEIDDAEMAETAHGTVYEVKLEKGEQEMEVVLDATGKVMKKKVEEEDED
ncbi:MAG: hypothetical protein EP338_04655 [Bacteroidetes bacterium]|nr:MAG: hypothetical protein EP338_04655 [Bacteroidota bacterium]